MIKLINWAISAWKTKVSTSPSSIWAGSVSSGIWKKNHINQIQHTSRWVNSLLITSCSTSSTLQVCTFTSFSFSSAPSGNLRDSSIDLLKVGIPIPIPESTAWFWSWPCAKWESCVTPLHSTKIAVCYSVSVTTKNVEDWFYFANWCTLDEHDQAFGGKSRPRAAVRVSWVVSLAIRFPLSEISEMNVFQKHYNLVLEVEGTSLG